jgi:hypothetical protein
MAFKRRVFKLPATEGNRERIFTLGNKGRAFLKDTHGCVLDWYFQPAKFKFFSYSAILHHLLLTRFLVSASWWCKNQEDFTLLEERVSYELMRLPPKVTVGKKSMTVIPDAWLLFGKGNEKFAVLFELDRGVNHCPLKEAAFDNKFCSPIEGSQSLLDWASLGR